MAYTTLPQAGINFSTTYGAATTASSSSGLDQPSPPWAVGTSELGSDNTKWVFCKAGGTLVAGDFVLITTATFVATALDSTNGLAGVGQWVGVAGGGVTVNQFLWVCVNGYLSGANVATSSSANVYFSTTATPGRVSTTATANSTARMSGAIGNSTAASNSAPVTLTSPVITGANA